MRAEDAVLILLAAGRSRRFGDADKLAQPFLHKPVAYHVVTALEAIPFLGRVAVIDGTSLDFASRGYDVIVNDDPAAGMSRSVQLGLRAARAKGAKGVVIALADMPRITAAHVYRLLDTARDDQHIDAFAHQRLRTAKTQPFAGAADQCIFTGNTQIH